VVYSSYPPPWETALNERRALFLSAMLAMMPVTATLADDVATIVRDFDAFAHDQYPVRAAQRGDPEAMRRWPDDSPKAVVARRESLERFRARLAAVDVAGLSGEDALNRELLVERVGQALDALRSVKERMPFISGDGFYTTADYAALNTVLAGETDAEAWLTTTTMTPHQIHELGLVEVARIRREMDRTRTAAGFHGTHVEFLAFLRRDPRFYVDGATYGEKASEIAKCADMALPRFFGRLPRLTYGITPIPKGLESSANGYLSGSPELGMPGLVFYRPWLAEKMPLFGLPAWALHEGVPGHHLQIVLAQELKDLPEFRRSDDITAYVEGWGLYAEKLGEDMGIYRDPYERFGRLSLEAWRACRLVIDTGLHVMGWTREQAMACLQENSVLAPAEFEVDRYIAWPARALAYKAGEHKILQLRRSHRAPRRGVRSAPLPRRGARLRADAARDAGATRGCLDGGRR